MKTFVSVLTSLWLALPLSASLDQTTDFIRVKEDAGAARLQTAITRYENANGTAVDLIGAIHVADENYYKTLEGKFAGYDVVLFEMVADAAALPTNAEPPAADKPEKKAASTHQLYSMMAKLLGLATQRDSIDYTKPYFVHADLSLTEFKQLQTEKGESLLGLMAKAENIPSSAQPDMARFMQAMLAGSTNRMKLEIVHTLGGGDDQIKALVGSNSVLIGDRNARCLEVFDTELQKRPQRVAIFYGAAHFPDMEEKLAAKGFMKRSQEWVTAWNIPKPATASTATSPDHSDASTKPVDSQKESTKETDPH